MRTARIEFLLKCEKTALLSGDMILAAIARHERISLLDEAIAELQGARAENTSLRAETKRLETAIAAAHTDPLTH